MFKILSKLRDLQSVFRNAYWSKRIGLIGSNSAIQPRVHFDYPRKIQLGNHCRIERYTILRANTPNGIALRLGNSVHIKEHVLINTNNGEVVIGDNCWIGPYSLIYGNGNVVIGDNVMIASHCAINTVSHHTDRKDIPMSTQGIHTAPVIIEDDVWVGIGAVILQGVRIGEGSIVGAGSVVTRNIPAGSIAVGVPARIIGSRNETETADLYGSQIYRDNLQGAELCL